jgi:acetyltransferase-like isoleucine patch superfamily enzyme
MVGFDMAETGRGSWRLAWNYLLMCLAGNLPPGRLQQWVYRRMGITIGRGVFIAPKVTFDPVYPENIVLEDQVFVGWGAFLFTHVIVPAGDGYVVHQGRIHVGPGAFVGGFAFLTCLKERQLEVGAGAVIASHAYVDRSVPPGVVVMGFPARVVKKGDRGNR